MSARIAGIALWLLATVVASAQAQTVEYLHTDALGSVVAVTNASRTVLERREYEPYGSQLTPAVTNGPGYTRHVQDAATGLVYMQQRYYDAQIGRFLSVDPVAAREKGDNFNRYAYAFDNPYRFTDPTGREGVGCWNNGTGCGGAGALGPGISDEVGAYLESVPDRISVSASGKAGIGPFGVAASVRGDRQTLQDGSVNVSGRSEAGTVGAKASATVDFRLIGPDVDGDGQARTEASASAGVLGATVQAGNDGVNVTVRLGPQVGVTLKGGTADLLKTPVTGGVGGVTRVDVVGPAKAIAEAIMEPARCNRAGCQN